MSQHKSFKDRYYNDEQFRQKILERQKYRDTFERSGWCNYCQQYKHRLVRKKRDPICPNCYATFRNSI